MTGYRLLLALLAICGALFLIVSFDSTRTVGAWFHGGGALPILFALATECGIVLCNVGRILRARNAQDARWFLVTMIVLIAMSATANALAGGARFTLSEAERILGDIAIARALRWPLIGAYGMLIPLCTFALSELAMALLVETHAQVRPDAQPDAPVLTEGTRTTRIVRFYQEQIEQGADVRAIPAADIARQFQVSAATVRKARAQVIEGGKR